VRFALLVLVVGCSGEPQTPQNPDGTTNIGWFVVFVSNPDGVSCQVCGPSTRRDGMLVLMTDQTGGPSTFPAPVDTSFDLVPKIEFPVTVPLVGELILSNYPDARVEGHGTFGTQLDGTLEATAYDADGNPVAIISSVFTNC